jgi:hypothetical protein
MSSRFPVAERRRRADVRAEDHGGVLSRRILRELGFDSHDIDREVEAGRWMRRGRQTFSVHRGDLGPEAMRWRAVWEVGHRVAAIDGVTALAAAGMSGFDEDRVHVSVRHTVDLADVPGVTPHKVIRRTPGEIRSAGVPRVRPAVAAIRAAHWAVSDRQAALVLVMPVQQRIVRPADLLAARRVARGRTRRALITRLVRDIADGAQSLGELDFAALCRAHGLPAPTRQAVRHGPRGRVYLDAAWEDVGLVVEIDGAGHTWGLTPTQDLLRQNDLVLGGEVILRIDLVGLRVDGERFLRQVSRAYRSLRDSQARLAPVRGIARAP